MMLERDGGGNLVHDFRFLIRDDWPWEIRAAIRKAADNDGDTDERTLACIRMFRAVICRAIADAYGYTGLEDEGERRNCVRDAREFFQRQDEQFMLVFACSGIDPVPILPHMLALSNPVDGGGKTCEGSAPVSTRRKR